MKRFRKKLSKGVSRRMFTHTAKNMHPKNLISTPMRGGFRI